MVQGASPKHRPHLWFNLFKYSIYGLLTLNVVLFLLDDWRASQHMFAGGISLAQLAEAFAATIDTAAWVTLLLLFELETYVIPDEKIKGRLKLTLHGVRALCYCIILYAFYGYVAKCISFYGFVPLAVTDLCTLAGQSFSFMTDFDEYLVLDAQNCQALGAAQSLLSVPGANVVADSEALRSAQHLAWADVINAGDWLLVVLVLEMDVRLQLKGMLEGRVLLTSKIVKGVLYSILVFAAIYWWVEGDFLDFWDAMLWIVAFVFIELNVFEWQEETSQARQQEKLKSLHS